MRLHVGNWYTIENWDGTEEVVKFEGIKGTTAVNHVAFKGDVAIVRYPDGTAQLESLSHFGSSIRQFHGPCLVISAY